MATVFLGRATGVGGFERLVAIKICHMHLREQPDFVSMFLDEARLAARIHHPNVVATQDVKDDEELYIVMDYVSGGNLGQILRHVGRAGTLIPVPLVLRILIDALGGLHAAHELKDAQGQTLNLVHRDISPQNLLVGCDGVTRIADFGVAKAEKRATATKPGQLKGKGAYMSPEQIRGREVDRRADIFAAAIVLWEALTGVRLFKSDSLVNTMSIILSGAIRRPSSLRDNIPASLDAAVKRALDRDPSRRFSSAQDFLVALEQCGVQPASVREVAEYVAHVLAKPIEAHRKVLQQADPSLQDSICSESEAIPQQVADGTDETLSITVVDVSRSRPRRSPWRWAALAVIPLAALAIWAFVVSLRPPANVPAADTDQARDELGQPVVDVEDHSMAGATSGDAGGGEATAPQADGTEEARPEGDTDPRRLKPAAGPRTRKRIRHKRGPVPQKGRERTFKRI